MGVLPATPPPDYLHAAFTLSGQYLLLSLTLSAHYLLTTLTLTSLFTHSLSTTLTRLTLVTTPAIHTHFLTSTLTRATHSAQYLLSSLSLSLTQ